MKINNIISSILNQVSYKLQPFLLLYQGYVDRKKKHFYFIFKNIFFVQIYFNIYHDKVCNSNSQPMFYNSSNETYKESNSYNVAKMN